ncbi:MAG: c-type cytochrome [Deltaproteobacteria bacterium]|nr:c-type cytochrome [Deltaproteobacteria bacterium]
MERIGRLAAAAALVLAGLLAGGSARAEAPDGGALYAENCERCHGVTGRGDGPDASLFASPPSDLRRGFLDRYPTEDIVRRIRSGVPLELALDPERLRSRAREVEAIAAYLERLPTIEWRRVEEGQAVYVDRCELCHGRTGTPELTLPPGARTPRDLSDPAFQASVDEKDLGVLASHGRGGMPAIGPPIAAGELRSLVAFVRLLSPGYVLYDRYCAACHGDDGRGAGSLAEEGERPAVVFDRAYFRRRDPEQVRTAVWHMLATKRPAMPHFRRVLTPAEVRAIVAYLKRAP